MPSIVRISVGGHVTLLFLVALTSVCPGPVQATGRRFEQPFVLADPSVIGGVTVASDVDRDGILDLVLMSPSVRILRGQVDGTYQEIQNFSPAGVWPALADLNGDLYPDLVWTIQTSPNTITVKLNNGDGTFGPELSILASGRSMHLEDVNGDGKRDMVYLETSNLRIRLGNGDGTFSAFANSYTTATTAQELEIADLNADGKKDVVVINGNTLSSFLGNGNGTFQARVDLATPGSQDVALGDVNGDGKVDAVVGSSAAFVYVHLGNGNGTFGAGSGLASPDSPTFVALADLNGDSRLDIAASHSIYVPGGGYFLNKVSTFLGNGDGTFAPMTAWDIAAPPAMVVVADLDRNGTPDLLVNNSLLFGNGDGTFGKVRRASTNPGPMRLALGDVNGDAKLDVVSANYASSSVTVALGNGNGGLGSGTSYATDTGPNDVALGDLDHDQLLDIITANNAGSVSILRGQSGGVFAPKTDIMVGTAAYGVAVGDMNGDGNLDLVVGRVGAISTYLGLGNGTFMAPIQDPNVRTTIYSVKLADMNGDGKLDLVATDRGGSPGFWGVSVYLGDGTGHFAPPAAYTIWEASPPEVADLNGDGKPDVVCNVASTGIGIFWGNGDGTLQSPAATIPVANLSRSIVAGDFDGDGYLDLATTPSPAGGKQTIQVLYGDGTAAFPRREYLGAGQSPAAVAAGFMHNPGRPDLVAVNQDGDDMTVLLNTSAVVGVTPRSGNPVTTLVLTGHPNPARLRYMAEIRLPRRLAVDVSIHDASGRLIRALRSAVLGAGVASIGWDLVDEKGRRVPTGVYLVQVRSGGEKAVSRFVVLE